MGRRFDPDRAHHIKIMLEEQRLKKLMRFLGDRITNYVSVDFNRSILDKTLYFNEFAKSIASIPGDLIELGFGYGHSAVVLCSLDAYGFKERKLYFFDSFKGFPK